MENINKQGILDFINSQQKKVVERIDLDKNTIKYSSKLSSHWDISEIRGEEEVVRLILMTKLLNEYGYKIDRLEIEEEYKAGRPKVIKPRVDLLVKDSDGDVFMFVELKAPDKFEENQDQVIEDQLFNLAALASSDKGYKIKYLVLATCDLGRVDFPVEAIVIDYKQYTTFNSWKQERNYANEIPSNYGLAMKEPFVKGGVKDLDKEYTKEQIDSVRRNLHNVLWGGGSVSDNDIFTSLVNLILAKIQDEGEKNEGDQYDFQILGYKDSSIKFESNQDLFNRINALYRRALERKMHIIDKTRLEKEFVINEEKFPLTKLKYAVSVLEKFSLVDGKNSLNGKDILGDFFESIIRNGFKQSKGQFFTHTNIVQFILWGLQIDKLAIEKINKDLVIPYVIDPSAGSGTFLIEYMKFITENVKRRFRGDVSNNRDVEDKLDEWFKPDHRENKWAKDFIYGIESNKDLGKASKVNMILHGDGSTNIFAQDGLLPFTEYKKYNNELNALKNVEIDNCYFDKCINGQFDIVISNPPFSVDLDNETKETLSNSFLFSSKRSSENLFIERYYQLLRENGRIGIVLPESLFDTSDNRYIRLFIYKYFKVKAVISLPSLAFAPYTSTKTSLLFAQKKTKGEIEEWDCLWKKYSSEYSKLNTRCKNILEVYVNGKNANSLRSIAKLNDKEKKELILSLIEKIIKKEDNCLDLQDLVKKYQNEIKEMCEVDNDCSEVFGRVNTFWVFGKVSKELNYDIFMADVQEIGYKRTTRGIKKRKNELFRQGEDGMILVNDGVKETVLDYLRNIKWD